MIENPLGRQTQYPDSYAPELLFSIARNDNRIKLGLAAGAQPFRGYDAWRAYELSWLDSRGKPVVATGEFIVPCTSECIVESKSLKLYLNSLNQTRFSDASHLQNTVSRDLARATQSPVVVYLYPLDENKSVQISSPEGKCLDGQEIEVSTYFPQPELLRVNPDLQISETVHSNLFRSNCPVTFQPDWGTVVISYSGKALDHAALLRYLISFRSHEGFHEDCAEKIFTDIMQHTTPQSLSVAINFLRRGGLEINPVRTTTPLDLDFPGSRFIRQ